MVEFGTFRQARRVPAKIGERVVDPAGWTPESLRDETRCRYHFTESDIDELIEAVASVRKAGTSLVDITRERFPLRHFADILDDVRRELVDGLGVAMLRGFPLDRMDREAIAIAYLGLGSYLGDKVSQNKYGHVLGHVKDLGGDYADSTTRGYYTRAELRFHTDPCSYVGLLCLQASKSGGASRVASSITLYNHILAKRPDLAQVLCEDFYRSRIGETNPGDQPFVTQPIFFFEQGYVSAVGLGASVDKAQGLPGVPDLTDLQREAIEAYRVAAEECAVDIDFRTGDIQFLHNFVTLHTRREYEDWPEPSRKRHLLRLWLLDRESRPLPERERSGRSCQGVHLEGVPLVAPLDVYEAA
jgi:hypothetical protein